MIGCSVQGYTRACSPTVGGASSLWVGDANDFDFTSDAPDVNGNATGYSAIALRPAGSGDTASMLLYGIDSLEDTINVVMSQANADGSSSAWSYVISARMAQFSQQMTNFNQKIDAAAACCQLVFVWQNNDGGLFVAGEKYVDSLLIPKFKLRQDGSKIDIGKKFTDFNGQDLSIKGDYSRPAYAFTGGILGLTAFLAVST